VLNDARYVEGTRRFERASLADRLNLALKERSMLYKFAAPKLGALAQAFNARFAGGVFPVMVQPYPLHEAHAMRALQTRAQP
jgi:hypothetical protein